MAWSYVKISMFGTAAAYSNDDEIIAAVAVLIQTPQKRPWGGSVPGHKTYKRDRLAADWQLNQTTSLNVHFTVRSISEGGFA
ncbi:hypothetical protein E2562_021686 [Oryza meyeriana var. granulata]|uniref:Uncharacterized protein n=1 Tax=Oryza meyeriana var. granulata TaxID=110450 RepID=A0A6G1DZP0_9ORYZ|nr:hypothetical protein E2562_021686 [Oryza meyeriana var. granulata]